MDIEWPFSLSLYDNVHFLGFPIYVRTLHEASCLFEILQ